MLFEDYLRVFVAFFGAAFAYIYGGWTTSLTLLCYLVAFDYLTGTLAAAATHQLNSKKGFMGASKKVMVFVAVGVAHMVDVQLNTDFIMQGCIFYYISGECVSLAENAASLGVPLPEVLTKALSNLPNKNGGGPGGQ